MSSPPASSGSGNGKARPYAAVTINSAHPKLRFEAIGLYVASGEGLKRQGHPSFVNDIPNLVNQQACDVALPFDGSYVNFYIGDPNGDKFASGCLVLRVGAKARGYEPDADTYVGIAYQVPLGWDRPQHSVTIIETEPNVDLINRTEWLKNCHSTWMHQLQDTTGPIYRAHANTSQPLLVSTTMVTQFGQCQLSITLDELGNKGHQHVREPLFIAAIPPAVYRRAQRAYHAPDLSAYDDEDSLLLNLVVQHSGVVLCNPCYYLETGKAGDRDPTDLVTFGYPGTARFTSTDYANSRGMLTYEIKSVKTHKSNYRLSWQEMPYLVIAWEVDSTSVQRVEDDGEGDSRYRYFVGVMRSDNPRFPRLEIGRKRLFDDQLSALLANEVETWVYTLPYIGSIKLIPRMAAHSVHMAQLSDDHLLKGIKSVALDHVYNGKSTSENYPEPAVIDVVIEYADEGDKMTERSALACPVLFLSCNNFHWENYDALLAINKMTEIARTRQPDNAYMLVENSANSAVQLERCYMLHKNRHDVMESASSIVDCNQFDLFDYQFNSSADQMQAIYVVKQDDSKPLGKHRQYLVSTLSKTHTHVDMVYEWTTNEHAQTNGEVVARFLEDTNVKAHMAAGELLALEYPMLDNVWLRVKHYHNLSHPNVATTIVSTATTEMHAPVGQAASHDTSTRAKNSLRIVFANKLQELTVDEMRALSVGWKGRTMQQTVDELGTLRKEWAFDGIPMDHGEGRALRLHLDVKGPRGAEGLHAIELCVRTYPSVCHPQHDVIAHGLLISKPPLDSIHQRDAKSDANYKSEDIYLIEGESQGHVLMEAYLCGSRRGYFALCLVKDMPNTETVLVLASAFTAHKAESLLFSTAAQYRHE
ncbi:hypothetical protein THASP1DRAFT_29947 [Thamnocephalis sphaerospora]|uniref:Uncharacterized protein n=1 Tax=Thamnocephalis sphaerospora TaxID=78915 RepID=A0A4P9XRW2_9FUNG|nr:hypothetical protein THASP1DRAFT_29947 [Thamnocephalis sphaerospora]|eukprot:RKP08251.1 hypothetical protein THASP1DRAFT_29947 [Thamnocephalis sphaerospora]